MTVDHSFPCGGSLISQACLQFGEIPLAEFHALGKVIDRWVLYFLKLEWIDVHLVHDVPHTGFGGIYFLGYDYCAGVVLNSL